MIIMVLGCVACTLYQPVVDEPKPSGSLSYVEFDFSMLPRDGKGNCSMTVTVLTADKDLKYSMESKGPKKFDPEVTAASWSINMRLNKFKAEVVDKTKVRVYGRIWNDTLIPASKGMVESPDLTKDELPTVKNSEKKG